MPYNSYNELLAKSPGDVAEVMMSQVRDAFEADPDREDIIDSFVFVGDLVWDECCGILASTWTRTFKTQTFPQQAVDLTKCDNSLLAVEVVIILLRCGPVEDANGVPPTNAEIDESAVAAGLDAALIFNALLGEMPNGWERANLEQTTQNAGGCIVIDTRLTIGLPQEDWCVG